MEVGAKCSLAVSAHNARIEGQFVFKKECFPVYFFIKLSQRDFLPISNMKATVNSTFKTISSTLLPLREATFIPC